MATGEHSVFSVPVLDHVVVEHKCVHVSVTTLLLQMEDFLVLDQHPIQEHVELQHAQ
jgi:hypothetical protein